MAVYIMFAPHIISSYKMADTKRRRARPASGHYKSLHSGFDIPKSRKTAVEKIDTDTPYEIEV